MDEHFNSIGKSKEYIRNNGVNTLFMVKVYLDAS